MKIISITALQPGDVKVKARNTQLAQNVQTILENLAKAQHKELLISADDLGKFERYQLQQKLQKAGAKVTVHSGTHTKTGKPVLIVRRLSDAEWKEYCKS